MRNPFCSGHVTLENLSALISLDDLGKSLFVFSRFSFFLLLFFRETVDMKNEKQELHCQLEMHTR